MKKERMSNTEGKWKKRAMAVVVGAALTGIPFAAHADYSNIPMQITDYLFKFLQDKAQQALNKAIRKIGLPGMDLLPLGDIFKIEDLDPRVAEEEAKASERYARCNERVAKTDSMDNHQGRMGCQFEYELGKQNADRVGVSSVGQSGHNISRTRRAAGEIANQVYREAAEQGVSLLKPNAAEQAEKKFVDSIFGEAQVNPTAMARGDEAQLRRLSAYMTMYPVPPIGNSLAGNGNTGGDWFQNSAEQTRLLTTALVGIREVSVMDQKTLDEGGYFLQAERLKKYARIQFARMVILQSLNPGVIESMNQMYDNYVKTPTDEELGGIDANGNAVKGKHYSMEQLGQLQLRQMQGVNWNLLEMRRLQMEGNRISGVLLAVMEDGAGDTGGRGGGIGVGGSGGGSPSAKAPSRSQVESYGVNE